MTRKQLVGRFHLFELGVLVAITATAFVKIPVGTDLPVHWDLNGHPDQTWPRNVALLLYPIIAVLLTGLFAAIGRFAPVGRIEPGRQVSEAMLTGLLGLCCALQFALVLIGIGSEVDLVRIIAFALAAVLIVAGVLLSGSRPNSYGGLRLPWHMTNAGNWVATHRLTGWLFILGGAGLGLLAWFRPDLGNLLIGMGVALFVPLLLGGAFSFLRSKF